MGAQISLKTLRSIFLWASAVSTLGATTAQANSITITDIRTEPFDTATGAGIGPGTIVIDSTGAINLGLSNGSNQSAITINSDHTVTNEGSITNTGTSATGILIDLTAIDTDTGIRSARNITSIVTNKGQIGSGSPTTSTDSNTSPFNAGIRVRGLGTFTGNIVNDFAAEGAAGIIGIDGDSSYGISVEGNMVGNIVNNGIIQAAGKSVFGIMTTGHVTGSIVTSGQINATGHQGTGVYVGGGLSGSYTHTGTIQIGTGSQLVSKDGFNLTRLPAVLGRNAIWIASDVTGGVLLQGNSRTKTEEFRDPDASLGKPVDSTIKLIGRGPAIFITPGGPSKSANNITIGPRSDKSGFSVVNSGNIEVSGAQGGISSTAIDIEGVVSGGVTYTTNLQGGFWNDGGNILISALDGTATAARIGDHGVVKSFVNDGTIEIFTADSTARLVDNFVGKLGGSGYGIVVESQGTLDSFKNTGLITVDVQGPNSSAYGILDRSGTLKSFSNSGTINTIKRVESTGKAIAVDLSANITGAEFTNSGAILGDVLLGAGDQSLLITNGTITGDLTVQAGVARSGNTALSMEGGLITGLVNIGDGNHTVSLSKGANLNGGLTQTGGIVNLNVNQSKVTFLSTAPLTLSTGNLGAGSTVTFDISGGGAAIAPILDSTGTLTIDASARLTAKVSSIIKDTETFTAIRAKSLNINGPLSNIVATPNSFMNDLAFSISPNDPNSIFLTVNRKSAKQLGLGSNFSSIYNSFATALNSDKPVATALSSLQNQKEFNAGLRQLLPDTSGATFQAALNNQDMGTGMIRRRLVAVAKGGLPNHAQGDVAGFWAQALGGYATQDAKGEQAGFSIWGLGIAIGADMPIFDKAHIGISLSESWQSASLNVTQNSPLEFYTTQLSLYARHQSKRFYSQAILTAAYNTYKAERKVNFGGLNRKAVGKWDGYQWGGAVETGAIFNWNLYELSPYVRGAYVSIHEDGYTESLGGKGVNLIVGDKDANSIRGSVGFSLDRDFPIYYDSYVETELRANYTRDIVNDPFTLSANFEAGDTPFTVAANKRNPNRINLGIGIAHKDSYSSVSVDYDTEIASDYLSHTASITARFRF
ncbi:MAG: hypothetical protein CMG46_07960 [Candidatus Marinimicrobia bacterium]|nr:hypothetical protein [Candidatus Neomarinimicrobiota bacterium]